MNRREFLQGLAAGLGSACYPGLVNGDTHRQKILILIELQGANDGLNTLIPYADPLYKQLRPKLAIQRDQVLQLSESTGLHPSCAGLMRIWEDQQLAIVQGVGYPNPNRSHFRSIEIWETASDVDEILQSGWLAPYLSQLQASGKTAADALALGQDAGPLAGSPHNTIVLSDMKKFLRQAKILSALEAETSNESLRHILSVQNSMQRASIGFAESFAGKPGVNFPFPNSRLGQQLKTVAGLINNTAGVSIFKLGLGSFDTHANQLAKHASLLKELSDAIASFQGAMRQSGKWDDILLMTYSEFGRRARENGSAGTDHGTAAVQFIAGGRVRGGFYGQQPSLSDLDNDDLKFTMDFRSIYHTIQRDWQRMPAISGNLGSFAPVKFVKT